jgi:hypothetical protein
MVVFFIQGLFLLILNYFTLTDEFDDLDVIVPTPQVQHVPEEKKIDLSKLSARERNKAKRALKENAKSKSKNQKYLLYCSSAHYIYILFNLG